MNEEQLELRFDGMKLLREKAVSLRRISAARRWFNKMRAVVSKVRDGRGVAQECLHQTRLVMDLESKRLFMD
ncbi:MAG: hypothetical protein K9N48_03320 [Verrucomicrobia bacterium]|nr:hypothetical protein [Verrucomicrobiota bacterium]MCF7708171.1 hypothetical protein [Verrucomicrobiota bacterium]